MKDNQKTCVTCKYFFPKNDLKNLYNGECKYSRNPKKFNKVKTTDWCGKHKPNIFYGFWK